MMGFFRRLIYKLTGNPTPPRDTVHVSRQVAAGGFTIGISLPGRASTSAEASDSVVAERAAAHAFVLTTDPPEHKAAVEWWNEETHKRRRREGSDKAYAWLLPFVPLDIARLPSLQASQERGPRGASAIAKELRALIREKRKAKEPHGDLLKALYGVCVAADLAKSLAFEGNQPRCMARFVDIDALKEVQLDYGVMGYQCIEALGKSDVKWLIEAFGEPADHQSFNALWPDIQRNAIARYCWKELRSRNESAKSLGGPQQSMQAWLNELVKRNLGYHKEWQERVATRLAYLAEQATVLDAAWKATRQPFVVADLETTGLNAETDEVLEFAAVRAGPDGAVTGEFSALVRVARVPATITRLTGITQELVDREGLPLAAAMQAFAEFVSGHAVFLHNAPFDQGFLRKSGAEVRVKLANPLHDTLPLARQAWPSLDTYRLAALTQLVGATAPTHRALADAKAALAVLLAARNKVEARAQINFQKRGQKRTERAPAARALG